MAWVCCKCNVEMEDSDEVQIRFGDMELPDAEGLHCPNCGADYIMKDFVDSQLASAEQMLQGK